jgi:hypothetical protein
MEREAALKDVGWRLGLLVTEWLTKLLVDAALLLLVVSWLDAAVSFGFCALTEEDRNPLANLISVSLLDFLSWLLFVSLDNRRIWEVFLFKPVLTALFEPTEVTEVDIASLDNIDAEESSSGDAKFLGTRLFGAEGPLLKIPEIVCIKVFFPCIPPLVFPDGLMLALFPPDMDEDEVVEVFEYLEGEFGNDVLFSFSSGLTNEDFDTGTFEASESEDLGSTPETCSFNLLFCDLITLDLLAASFAFLLTGIPNFAGSVSGVAGS